jgi:hypothetical protein
MVGTPALCARVLSRAIRRATGSAARATSSPPSNEKSEMRSRIAKTVSARSGTNPFGSFFLLLTWSGRLPTSQARRLQDLVQLALRDDAGGVLLAWQEG